MALGKFNSSKFLESPRNRFHLPRSPRNDKLQFLDSSIPRGMKSSEELPSLIRMIVFQWSLEKLYLFAYKSKKDGFITLIMSKFWILKACLWLISRKRVIFIVFSFLFEFWEIFFLNFWGLQKLLLGAKSAQIDL